MSSSHIPALDFMRGIAAFCVVFLHWFEGNGSSLFGSSLLAVDLFFMLSGFVIAMTFQQRLVDGQSAADFLKGRFIRLYPLIFVGVFLGFFGFLVRGVVDNDWDLIGYAAFHFATNLLMIPDLTVDAVAMYPLNIALWSLFYEIAAYLAFALFLYRRKTWVLAVLAGIGVVTTALWIHLNFGGSGIDPAVLDKRVFGLSRVASGFLIGMILFRFLDLLPDIRILKSKSLIFLPLAVFVLPRDTMPAWFFDIVAFIGFPVMILIAAKCGFGEKFSATADLFGRLSYPLYVMHTPMIWMLAGIFKKMPVLSQSIPLLEIVLIFPATLTAAYLALRYYDEPLRRYLKGHFLKVEVVHAP